MAAPRRRARVRHRRQPASARPGRLAPVLDERWIRSLHVESMRRADLHAEREHHVLFQASTIGALLEGAYEGDLSFAELAEHGDLGLGTLNRLDGEMIALDGEFFRADVEGRVHPVAPAERTPFAVVTRFEPEVDVRLEGPLEPRGAAGADRLSWSRPAPPPARSASTAASSWSAPARCRPSARPTGRWPRSSPNSTSSSSPTSRGRCSASASPPGSRGSRSPATTCTSSAPTAAAAATSSARALAAARLRIDPSDDLHVELPPAVDLADPDLAAATHARDRQRRGRLEGSRGRPARTRFRRRGGRWKRAGTGRLNLVGSLGSRMKLWMTKGLAGATK